MATTGYSPRWRLLARWSSAMLDLNGRCLAGGENDALGYMIDMDTHRDALRQTHPGEDRVDRREALRAGLRIGNVDAARDAVDVAADDIAVPHQLELRRIALANGGQRGLGEVGIDPEGIGIDERHLVLPDIGVVAELREQVGHPAVDRRVDLRALEVDAGLVALGVGLRQARLSAGALRVQRVDLPLRELQVCLGGLHRRLFLSLLGAELLGALNGAVALFRQLPIARRLLLGEYERGLRLLHLRLARVDLRLLHGDLRVRVLHVGLRLLHRRLRELHGNLVVRRIDHHQQLALGDELIVDDRQLDDAAGDLRRHRDGIDAHGAVARPGRLHIGLPHRPAEPDRQRGRGERDQDRNDSDPRPVDRASSRLGGADDTQIGTLAALGFGFDVGHDKSQRAMTSTIEDSTIMYTANTNSEGCQTWRISPKRSAIRRNPMVTNHAAMISNEIGAT